MRSSIQAAQILFPGPVITAAAENIKVVQYIESSYRVTSLWLTAADAKRARVALQAWPLQGKRRLPAGGFSLG